MEAGNERLFRVLGDVGSDLIATAERKVFPRSAWRRILPAAACLVLLAGAGLAASPYFTGPRETAAPLPSETAEILEEARADAAVGQSETPEAAQDYAETQNAAVDKSLRIQPVEQLVFWDTVYYVEAQYTREEASTSLGEHLGTVEQADDAALSGADVYTRQGAEVREDYKERQVPLEIFVENESGYLYCLTYYLSDEPLMEWEAVYSRYYAGKLGELVERFVAPMEQSLHSAQMEMEYYSMSHVLTADQAMQIFLTTLEMERQFGTRTEDLDSYLWQKDNGYVIPVEDVWRQLERYLYPSALEAVSLEAYANYDAETQTVVLPSLDVIAEELPVTMEIIPEKCALYEDQKSLRLVVHVYEGDQAAKERCYMLQFESGKTYFDSIGCDVTYADQ